MITALSVAFIVFVILGLLWLESGNRRLMEIALKDKDR